MMEAGNGVTWILVSATILLKGASTNALQCYSCELTDDCKDPFSADGISIISSIAMGTSCNYCLKYKGLDPDDNEGDDEEVWRYCESASSLSEECQPFEGDGKGRGITGDICYCQTDLCNQSSHVTPLILLSGVFSVFSTLLVQELT